jgi:hypothetical protein
MAGGTTSYSPALPPTCHKQRSRAVSTGQSRSLSRRPLGWAPAPDLGWGRRPKLHGMQGVRGSNPLTLHPRSAALSATDLPRIPGLGQHMGRTLFARPIRSFSWWRRGLASPALPSIATGTSDYPEPRQRFSVGKAHRNALTVSRSLEATPVRRGGRRANLSLGWFLQGSDKVPIENEREAS